ncbi:hypothetical protein CLOHYLEM_05324 [[Clostridium] hylemonae DSM 15053]|uniref:Uncharacterized protein n=1 Tax=[Clostridium] hylemonae DSM 15053 TaxID=553973 RepID=C0BZT3_9FIRM|nr:hypothetical protein CLOHYLEM_05324 [[Clostridium] hylemonae DSM 15053]
MPSFNSVVSPLYIVSIILSFFQIKYYKSIENHQVICYALKKIT